MLPKIVSLIASILVCFIPALMLLLMSDEEFVVFTQQYTYIIAIYPVAVVSLFRFIRKSVLDKGIPSFYPNGSLQVFGKQIDIFLLTLNGTVLSICLFVFIYSRIS